MPAPLTIAARRAMVEELLRQEPALSARNIAARLGVGKDTVRRDIDAIETEKRQRTPQRPTAEPERAPDTDRITLVLDARLRQALAVLRATRGLPDTRQVNAVAARTAILSMASIVLEARQNPQEGTHR
ncbi:HTH domain-containing protein [Streptomyces beihaiensis]|uniref:Helix-turn-helix domain-containing protein n=1 Tax=Streptomyces beihaiensis TaxID=2984495 RepID=A0ABT3TRB0_9ACTN|nr:HTH domain-containing protein [Streptomyces beihaiensis]MCX3059570.1 helix-turn-helix domain-containing protein [Streptomyces beihaiensis]